MGIVTRTTRTERKEIMSKKGRGALMEQLLAALSDEEIADLARELKNHYGDRCGEGIYFLRNVGPKSIFSFLNFNIFGSWACITSNMEEIVNRMDEVRGFIKQFPPVQISKPENKHKEMPHELSISNTIAGVVFVRTHAWERFIERWEGDLTRSTPEVIARLLGRMFADAVLTPLKGHHTVVRIISNNFQPAKYY